MPLSMVKEGEPNVIKKVGGKEEKIRLWCNSQKEEIMKTLKEVACGQTVKVKKLSGEGPVKRRIMDMGITKGVDVYVRKVAPLGDPVEVTVRGYELSLRKADAEMIEVE